LHKKPGSDAEKKQKHDKGGREVQGEETTGERRIKTEKEWGMKQDGVPGKDAR
jgi:hypothetical protein